MKLHFAKEFSSYPQGRYESDGKYSGEAFRNLLMEKFQQAQDSDERLEVILDNVETLSGIFIDEAFGKFAKQLKEQGRNTLSEEEIFFHGDEPHYEHYIHMIWKSINKYYVPDGQKDVA